jgi:NAD(P)H-hydrate epimerase
LKESQGIVYVTAEEMRQIDAAAIGEFGLGLELMMENAGRSLAVLAKGMLLDKHVGGRVCCPIGGGNNGGGGLVAARHLHNWGIGVVLATAVSPSGMKEAPKRQFEIVQRLGVPVLDSGDELHGYSMLVDAILGYGQVGPPRGPAASLIRRANASGTPILSLDIPSGLDPDSGKANEPCIKATATLTLALPKIGFLNPSAKAYLGRTYLADISIPSEVYKRFGQRNPLFAGKTILQLG